jgi:hypothetical protein
MLLTTEFPVDSVAYAFSTDPDPAKNISTLRNWPGGNNRDLPKAPTVIKYDDSTSTKFKWGYEVDSTDEKIEGFKLLLDPTQPRPDFLKLKANAGEKWVEKVVSDYMKAIYEHAIKEIREDFLVPELLDGYEKLVILTVPAVWSDRAKDATMRVNLDSCRLKLAVLTGALLKRLPNAPDFLLSR